MPFAVSPKRHPGLKKRVKITGIVHTNAGWLGHTFQDIRKLCPDSEVAKEMNIEFSEDTLKTSGKEIENWIEGMQK